jgi:hypothetical protein
MCRSILQSDYILLIKLTVVRPSVSDHFVALFFGMQLKVITGRTLNCLDGGRRRLWMHPESGCVLNGARRAIPEKCLNLKFVAFFVDIDVPTRNNIGNWFEFDFFFKSGIYIFYRWRGFINLYQFFYLLKYYYVLIICISISWFIFINTWNIFL